MSNIDISNSGLSGSSTKWGGITTSVMPNGRSLGKRNERYNINRQFTSQFLHDKYYGRFSNITNCIIQTISDDGWCNAAPRISTSTRVIYTEIGITPPDFAITKLWLRFSSVPIKALSQIKSAVLKVALYDYSGDDGGGSGYAEFCSTTIKCFNEDNPANPTSYADFTNRTKTTASTVFAPGVPLHFPDYWRIDVTSCVQEVINRVGFGQKIMFALEETAGLDTFPICSKREGRPAQLIIN